MTIIKSLRTKRQDRKAHEKYLRELEVKLIVQEHIYALMSDLSKNGKL